MRLVKIILTISALVCNLNVAHAAVVVGRESFADLVQNAAPAVVSISIVQKQDKEAKSKNASPFPFGHPFNDFLDQDFLEKFPEFAERFGNLPGMDDDSGEEEEKPSSAGSGFIIDTEGHIVTNFHVVMDAAKIKITLNDNSEHDATLVGSDQRSDLAVLKINSKIALKSIKFGESDKSRVGDLILAIGNSFGLGTSVTSGIVSAQARDINTTGIVDNFIQTDAAINKGNSGGPMLNMDGEVIGINTLIFSPSGGNVGVGFAIPASFAKPIIDQIIKSGHVQRSWIGVSIQSTEGMGETLGIEDGRGALVSGIIAGAPADKAGIVIGDVIMKFDGKQINTSRQLSRIVAETPIGKKVEIELFSAGKKKITSTKLEELDYSKENKVAPSKLKNLDQRPNIVGMTLSNITKELAEKYDLPKSKGVLVLSVDKTSQAYKRGVRKGDIITGLNQVSVSDVDSFEKLLNQVKVAKKKKIILLVERGEAHIFIQLPVQL